MRPCLKEPESETKRESEAGAEFGLASLTRRLGESGAAATSGDSVVVESSLKLAPMPSVGMRRSTRVFVPKTKDGEIVKVLRSGRRLWVDSSGDGILKGGKDVKEWSRLTDTKSGRVVVNRKQNGWHNEPEVMEIDHEDDRDHPERVIVSELIYRAECGDKMYGKVYSRKRKRDDVKNSGFPANRGSAEGGRDKMYGLHFVRRQKTGKICPEGSAIVRPCNNYSGVGEFWGGKVDIGVHGVLTIVVETSCARSCRFASLLSSVLRHMTIADVGLLGLSAFLVSKPISRAFASCGINFFWNCGCIKNSGLCMIYGARHFIPLFAVHFAAVPVNFVHLHASLFFRSVRLSAVLLYSRAVDGGNESTTGTDIDGHNPCINVQCVDCRNGVATSRNDDIGGMEVDLVFGAAKVDCQNLSGRASSTTRVGQKRRRRSLRTRRARNPSLLGLNRANGSLVPDRAACKKKANPSVVVNNHELRRSVRKSSASDIKVLKSTLIGLSEDIDSVCCAANILVVESDRCYRVEGANVMLETSASNEWVLSVKIGGLTRYCHKAQKEIKPTSSNRFSHAVIWAGENGWKLEFPNRKEWTIFKELYRVCGERNLVPPSPIVKVIPVPGVYEVDMPQVIGPAAFVRPDAYIKLNDDELSRALLRRTANYDMDSEDEEWLKNFNGELGDDTSDHVAEETFELMVDAFEKALYCSPEDYSDEKAAVNLCLELGRREVVEGVHGYWLKKRKQKRAPLVRVFQSYQPRRPQVIAKPILRKKRSLKRQASMHAAQCGRGKERSVLKALAAEQNAKEEQTALLKVQEARASAKRSSEVAIIKRQRAQFLMGSADLAMYRAAMALSIAEAAQVAESHQAAGHFLD
ncbi:hypothetical protein Ancab_023641 [Ancistrocladus abbreviatus]